MCGIVGIIGKQKNKFLLSHLDLFEEMLWADALRGRDATGAFSVLSNTQVKLIKNEQGPEFLVGTKEWDKFRQTTMATGHVLIGHNRKATFGNITRENAHPFAEQNIILVHNGTVSNNITIKNVEVDSHVICHNIVKDGYEKTLKELDGSFALIWYNIKEQKLYAIRNDQRPLCVSESDNFVFFASEGYMLGWLLARNNIKTEKITMLDPMKLQIFSFSPYKTDQEDITKKTFFSGHKFNGNCYNSNSVSNLQDVLGEYQINESVIFIPKSCREDTALQDRWKVQGTAYLPGKTVIQNAVWIAPSSVDFEEVMGLAAEEKLIGIIRNLVHRKDQETTAYLSDIKTDLEIVVLGEEVLLRTEWNYIVDNFKCDKCNGNLDKEQPTTTSVFLGAMKDAPISVRCLCSSCVKGPVNESIQTSNPAV